MPRFLVARDSGCRLAGRLRPGAMSIVRSYDRPSARTTAVRSSVRSTATRTPRRICRARRTPLRIADSRFQDIAYSHIRCRNALSLHGTYCSSGRYSATPLAALETKRPPVRGVPQGICDFARGALLSDRAASPRLLSAKGLGCAGDEDTGTRNPSSTPRAAPWSIQRKFPAYQIPAVGVLPQRISAARFAFNRLARDFFGVDMDPPFMPRQDIQGSTFECRGQSTTFFFRFMDAQRTACSTNRQGVYSSR